MDIEKAKKIIEKGIKPEYERLRQYEGYKYTGGWLEAIEVLLNELDKKDKIINKAVDIIENYQICDYEITDYRYRKCEYIADDETPPCKECIREYLESE